jgi:hypothetical protein
MRIDLDRLGDKLECLVELTGLKFEKAVKVQCVEIVRDLFDQSGERPLGFGNTPMTLKDDRLLQAPNGIQETRIAGRQIRHSAFSLLNRL